VATLAGGALLVVEGRSVSVEAGLGALAVVVATIAWAGDSVLSRPLSERNTAHVVLAKGALGALLTFGVGRSIGETWPSPRASLALAACGAVGYGAGLRLYLHAQTLVGAARTGTVFAAAPFIGAGVAWAMGERGGGIATAAAAGLCAVGVALQLTESHDHAHTHPAVEHDHPHRHDDGHHDHDHDNPPKGEHAHPHRHEGVSHEHPHGQDVHHRHTH
jgi:drug/metabolite transporter (DMT)-like permease